VNYFYKICILVVIVISSVACSSVRNDDGHSVQASDIENKADYKQAALLNIELGQTYLVQGQVSRAKKKLLHAVELAPNLPEAHSSLGYFFESVGDNQMADKYYRKAISLGKEQGLFHNNYGIFLCNQNKYKEADKEFALAIKDYNYPKTAETYENAGLCALKAGDQVKAEANFNFAVRYDPKQVASLLELTDLYFKRGEFVQAQDYLNRLKSQVEPSARMLWLAIQIAKNNNDPDSIASSSLLLKNKFANSVEYNLYLQSQEK